MGWIRIRSNKYNTIIVIVRDDIITRTISTICASYLSRHIVQPADSGQVDDGQTNSVFFHLSV
jgi:hypothetical protein